MSLIKKENVTQAKPLVYISHPYGGLEENKNSVEAIIKRLISKYPNYVFISPIHTFGFLYNYVDYETGLNMCLELLSKCNTMWVFGDWQNSKGCKAEIEYCNKAGKPYRFLKEEN